MKEIYNQEYERAILGSLLLDNNCYDTVNQYVDENDFYVGKHKSLFRIIAGILQSGDEANLLTVNAKYRGNAHEVAELTSFPSAANVEYYCKCVRDYSVRRRLRTLTQGLTESVTQESNNVEDLVENLEAQLTELLDRKTQSYVKAEALVTPAIQLIEELYKNQGILGIPTGYKTVDDFTGGFISGEMTVLGARASIGKTALALNMAEKIARRGTGVGFLSLEMSGSQLMQRLLCGNSGIGMRRIRTGQLWETDFKKIVDAAEMVYAYPLYIYDEPNARLIDLKLKARRMLRAEHIKILFIDYLSLVRTEKDLARWEEVGFISSELKSLARELDIPIVVCAQVNRDAEGKAPNLSNLRESGSIEQDADVVMFLHRKRDSQNSELIIAKNRNGGTGKIALHFNMERTRFELVEASA